MLVGTPEGGRHLSLAGRLGSASRGRGRSRGLSLGILLGGRWRRLSHALDAFSKASQSFAETLAELRQPPRSEEQESNDGENDQVSWL